MLLLGFNESQIEPEKIRKPKSTVSFSMSYFRITRMAGGGYKSIESSSFPSCTDLQIHPSVPSLSPSSCFADPLEMSGSAIRPKILILHKPQSSAYVAECVLHVSSKLMKTLFPHENPLLTSVVSVEG